MPLDPDNTDYLAEAAQFGLVPSGEFSFPDSVEDAGPSEFMAKRSAEFKESGSSDDFDFFHLV